MQWGWDIWSSSPFLKQSPDILEKSLNYLGYNVKINGEDKYVFGISYTGNYLSSKNQDAIHPDTLAAYEYYRNFL